MSNPALLIWNRLEPQPRSNDIEKALRAEIRDPLWMLCRQWQFGEFHGEDAGMASLVRLNYRNYSPHQINWRDDTSTEYKEEEQPLEVLVEKSEYKPDLYTRIEIGRHWVRLLNKHFQGSNKATIIDKFRNSQILHFNLPAQDDKNQKFENADLLSDENLINTLTAITNTNAIDGGILIDIISNNEDSLSKHILGAKNESVDAIGQRLLEWAKRVYNVKTGESKGWHPAHLEHQFDIKIPSGERVVMPSGGGPVREFDLVSKLEAKEFFGDTLDWYQFDYSPSIEAAGTNAPNVANELEEVMTPSQVRYLGMPDARWWKMEDNMVNFGNIKADKTNPTALIFSQFALIYGNDWLMMPLSIEVGTYTKIHEMVVTDNFGFQSKVQHIHEEVPNENWGFFQIHDKTQNLNKQNDTGLFLPPTIEKAQISKPVEQVNFIRDEMANMVWAIEEIVPDKFGTGIKGSERAGALSEYLSGIEEIPARDNLENQATLKYTLATTTPENWIPFIPIQMKISDIISRQIQLRRASMPRVLSGFKPVRIRPKSFLLNKGLSDTPKKPYDIFEEEIPRSGAIVKGHWKRVRWYNGKTYVWYARQKTNGRGEEESGLKFDVVEEK